MSTNFSSGSTGSAPAVNKILTDEAGNAILTRCTVANIPSAVAGYAVGGLLQATDTGGIYTNTGSITSATFTLLEDAGGLFTLPVTATYTSTSTSGSVSAEPLLFNTTMSGVGGVGGRAHFTMTTNVALGGWSNAIKGEVTYGASGSTSGLGSAIVSEMTLSAGTSAGTYTLFEGELNLGSGASVGTNTSLAYFSINGADAATFSTSGNTSILNIQGLTAGASNVFRTGLTGATVVGNMTAALRIKVGATTYFIPLATATT